MMALFCVFVGIVILIGLVYNYLFVKHPSPYENKPLINNKLDTDSTKFTNPKFKDNELFCKKCHCHDYFFVGGGSWAPDWCPFCRGTACVVWKDIPFIKRARATIMYDKMWEWVMTGPNGSKNPRGFPREGKVPGFEDYYQN